MSTFAHLHVHTEYSLLDGMCKIDELIARAQELGMDALAITDHGAMYGVMEFYQLAKSCGIRPIVGCEVYVAPEGRQRRVSRQSRPFHLVLLARSETGYKNLIQLTTRAHLQGFYYKPRVDKELLQEYSADLTALSACGSGEVPRLIQAKQMDAAQDAVRWYQDVFGHESFYLELQRHVAQPDLEEINQGLIALGRDMGAGLVATNDVHYVRQEDAAAHEVLLCLQTGTTMDDPDRMRMGGDDYYLRSAEEMAALFSDLPEALENTQRIAADCRLEFSNVGFHLPPFEVPAGHTPQTYLAHLCQEGMSRRYSIITPNLQARLEHELKTIHDMGFDVYFLIVWDLVRYAMEHDIWWYVRGSAAASIVAYSLGLTNLEPLAHELIFERFLNPGRITMPDIDVDFPDERRGEIIQYINDKYGADRVAQIGTFGTLAARASIRNVGRALGLPPGEVDRLAKLIPFGAKIKLHEALESSRELKDMYEQDDYIRDLVDKALRLEGVARNVATHAAGIVIADKPLTEYVPVQRPPKSDEQAELITQYPGGALEEIGLLKIDILGLSTLTIMRRAVDLINKRHGTAYTLDNIPVDDPVVYELLAGGNVIGVFQVESAGMRRVLQTLQPSSYEDIVALLSLYRPGPMQFIDSFVARRHGHEKVEYIHPSLEPILRDTHGIIVYQEQIMRIATDIAGYSASEADLMRRAVSKKKEEELNSQHDTFVSGAVARGIPADKAQEIFDEIEFFGRYGFNKAHSASYAVITCQTAHLKAHYPVEYMTALLSVERNNQDKIGPLVTECRRLGIPVLAPDVNRSGIDFATEDLAPEASKQADQAPASAIRFGLAAIKNVGEGPLQPIMDARSRGGPFADLADFCRRVDLHQVNKRTLECLVKAGALDSFGQRPGLLAVLNQMMSLSQVHHEAAAVGQLTFASLNPTLSGEDNLEAALKFAPPISEKEMLAWEKELMGAYLSEHPLQRLTRAASKDWTLLDQIDESLIQQKVSIAGAVKRVQQALTRAGEEMAFVDIEDLNGSISAVVFPGVYAKCKELLAEDQLLLMEGTVEERNGTLQLRCESVQDFALIDAAPSTSPVRVRLVEINLRCSGNRERDMQQLREAYQVLGQRKGSDRFRFNIISDNGCVQLDFPNATTRFESDVENLLKKMLGDDALHVQWTQA